MIALKTPPVAGPQDGNRPAISREASNAKIPTRRFRNCAILAALFHALFICDAPCQGDPGKDCEVAVAALNLPPESDGVLHWRSGQGATTHLQLSLRYFSEPVKMRGGVIQFFREPVSAEQTAETTPEPLVTVNLPAGSGLTYLVLATSPDGQGGERWRSNALRSADWKEGSLKLVNGAGEPLGIIAGKKKIPLTDGKSFDFPADAWADPFPLEIYRVEKEAKKVFSSVWRVTPGRRELCYVGASGGTIRLRSLIAFAPKPVENAP